MVKRNRLSRNGKGMRKEDRLRKDVSVIVRGLPNDRLLKYAGVSSSDPVASRLAQASREEIQRRKHLQQVWAKGIEATKPKKGIPIKKYAQDVFGMVGKGINEYVKLISGEKAREFEEAVDTAGMTPEQKKAYKLKKQREREAEQKEMESFMLV